MSINLQNGHFAATINDLGAELKSLVDLASGREHIWHGDPAWWNGSAPVLFPIVGGLKDGTYLFEGKKYALPNHGFARASQFTVARQESDSADLMLTSNTHTRESYPFDFSLSVAFFLERSGLSVHYRVSNNGSPRMYFSIGSHPAFVVPFAGGTLENYYVMFDREEHIERWFIKDNLVIADTTEEVFENSRVISLSRSLFDRGALVFKHPQSREFSIRNSLSFHAVTVVTESAPYLGIWAKPGAPFLCIEPWHGLADSTTASGTLAEKEGILYLDSRGTFDTGYRVEIK